MTENNETNKSTSQITVKPWIEAPSLYLAPGIYVEPGFYYQHWSSVNSLLILWQVSTAPTDQGDILDINIFI